MAVNSLNRVKFAGADFDTHNDDIRARTQIQFAAVFNEFALSSLGIVLIDQNSFGLSTLSFYLDRRATDLYLETARTRKSVARLTRQLGYKMRPAVAASVDLQVSIRTAVAFAVPLPAGFQFRGPNSLIFEAAETVVFPAGSDSTTPLTVPARQGQTLAETFTSDGSANQVFALRRVPTDAYVVQGSVTVLVDGAPFEEVEFLEFGATDQVEIGYNDDPPTVRFGDGTFGSIPTDSATITVTYVAAQGKAGLVAANTITAAVTSLVVMSTTIALNITNPQGSVGADDPETLEHAKTFAARVFKSRKVAVTRSDYEALAGSYADPLFGAVAVAQAISARSSAADLIVENELDIIESTVSAQVVSVDAATDILTAGLDNIGAQLAVLSTGFDDIATLASDIDTDLLAAIASARAVKNRALEIKSDAAGTDGIKTKVVSISTDVTSGKAAVDASSASAGEKATINAFFDSIEATNSDIDLQADSINSAGSSVSSNADAQITTMGISRDRAADIGLTVASGELLEADTARASIESSVGVVGPPATGMRAAVETIDTVIVDTATSTESTVEAAADAIREHFDRILSDDCKANLVVVPILSRDSGGFYAAPSTGLVKSLQNYLDARKEVTQTVEVTSGVLFLVPVVLVVRLGVSQGFSESVTKTSVEAAIDGVLRDRLFGSSLYISDLTRVIVAVEGVSFANVQISGSVGTSGTTETGKLDAEGNLIIEKSEVITKGTVTVTPETVLPS